MPLRELEIHDKVLSAAWVLRHVGMDNEWPQLCFKQSSRLDRGSGFPSLLTGGVGRRVHASRRYAKPCPQLSRYRTAPTLTSGMPLL